METTTLYWIVGIVIFILWGFSCLFWAAIGYFAAKRPGAVPGTDLISGKKIHIEYDTMKESGTIGMKLVRRRYGPFGILSEWKTIPEPYIVKDKEGRPEKLYWPRDVHIKQTLGFVEAEAGELIEAEMMAEEMEVRLAESNVITSMEQDVRTDKYIKQLGEAMPYANLKKGGQKTGGANSGYRQ